MTFTTFCRLLSQAVIHSRQPVALNWARNSFGLVLTVFLRKICILGIAEYFLIVLFQISEIKKDEIRFKKYIFLLDMFLIVGGEGSSNRNASRDESVEAGDKSVEAGDESIEAGEKTPQSCYNSWLNTCIVIVSVFLPNIMTFGWIFLTWDQFFLSYAILPRLPLQQWLLVACPLEPRPSSLNLGRVWSERLKKVGGVSSRFRVNFKPLWQKTVDLALKVDFITSKWGVTTFAPKLYHSNS